MLRLATQSRRPPSAACPIEANTPMTSRSAESPTKIRDLTSRIESLQARFRSVREQTMALCAPLEPEDFVLQAMPEASPTKWHLAHTTWFFETFVLANLIPDYHHAR